MLSSGCLTPRASVRMQARERWRAGSCGDGHKLHEKDQIRVRWDKAAADCPATVGKFGGNHEHALSAYLHRQQTLVPALDHLRARGELSGINGTPNLIPCIHGTPNLIRVSPLRVVCSDPKRVHAH